MARVYKRRKDVASRLVGNAIACSPGILAAGLAHVTIACVFATDPCARDHNRVGVKSDAITLGDAVAWNSMR